MDQLSTLKTLSQIRHKRVEDAQMGVLLAHRQLTEKKDKLVEAQKELADYQKELPTLIETLYKDVINHKIDVLILQDKVAQEVRLTHHLEILQGNEKDATKAVSEAEQHLSSAQGHLQAQERKKDATDELVKKAVQKSKKDAERALGKVIDELASMRYVLNS